MADGDGGLEVRSYRAVFALERRLYRIDRLRLNPGGVPVRGLLYAALAAAAVLALAAVPLLGWPLRLLPWHLRYLGLPGVLGVLLTIVRIDGRPFHVAVRSLWALIVGPRHLSAFAPAPPPGARWRPTELVLIPDGSDARLRRLRYRGPGAVLVRAAHRRVPSRHRRGRLALRERR